MSLDKACEHVQKMVELARRENPQVIVLAHGGPISSAEDTRYLYEKTDAQGFLGASSMERIPVEAALVDAVRAFKSKRPRASRTGRISMRRSWTSARCQADQCIRTLKTQRSLAAVASLRRHVSLEHACEKRCGQSERQMHGIT